MITLTREEAEHVLKLLDKFDTFNDFTDVREPLRAKLSEPELKEDGYCQACEGNHCTAKTGCVAISNLPQREWQGLTVDEFYDLDDVGRKMILEYGRLVEAKLREKNVND